MILKLSIPLILISSATIRVKVNGSICTIKEFLKLKQLFSTNYDLEFFYFWVTEIYVNIYVY